MNIASQEPFIRAAKELVGEDNVYPMIALGLFQVKSAWKLFSRIHNIEPDLANEVSNYIEDWAKAKKYADEEDKDSILVEDYIPTEYLDIFNESKDMRNIIDTIKPHACGVLISPISITDHIGLISVGGEEDRVICTAIEGNIAGDLGYLKNDYLIVGVVEIIDKIYKSIGIKQPTPAELVEMCEGDQAVWDIYSKGITFEVNQMTSPRTVKYLKEFKPTTIYDLSTVVASIRPSAISVVDRMMSRKPYSYGSKIIDDLLSSHTGSTPAILYQESIMRLLALAGFPQKETYTILKAISKKKESVIQSAKDKFNENIYNLVLEETGDKDVSANVTHSLWVQVEDSAAYGFNSPHSLSTALDSLYIAYLKVHHFDETYAVLLDYYSLGKKRDIGKVSSCKKELESLSYRIEQIKYGQDNTKYAKQGNSFVQSMLALKGTNPILPQVLKDMKTDSLMEIYVAIKEPKNPETNRAYNTKAHFCLLCSIGYFPTNNKKASIYIPMLYDSVYSKKQFRKTSWDKLLSELGVIIDINNYITRATAATYYLDPLKIPKLCDDLYDLIECDDYTPKEQVENEIKAYGVLNDPSRFFSDKIYYGIVKAISKKNNSLLIELYSGKEQWIKLKDVSLIKRQQTIIILKAKMVGKDVLVTDYLNY